MTTIKTKDGDYTVTKDNLIPSNPWIITHIGHGIIGRFHSKQAAIRAIKDAYGIDAN